AQHEPAAAGHLLVDDRVQFLQEVARALRAETLALAREAGKVDEHDGRLLLHGLREQARRVDELFAERPRLEMQQRLLRGLEPAASIQRVAAVRTRPSPATRCATAVASTSTPGRTGSNGDAKVSPVPSAVAPTTTMRPRSSSCGRVPRRTCAALTVRMLPRG